MVFRVKPTPIVLIPRWTTHPCFLYQVCATHGARIGCEILEQIAGILCQCHPRRLLLMIRQSFTGLSVSAFTLFYKALFGPQLENVVLACPPSLIADAHCLRRIQQLASATYSTKKAYEGWACLRGDLVII